MQYPVHLEGKQQNQRVILTPTTDGVADPRISQEICSPRTSEVEDRETTINLTSVRVYSLPDGKAPHFIAINSSFLIFFPRTYPSLNNLIIQPAAENEAGSGHNCSTRGSRDWNLGPQNSKIHERRRSKNGLTARVTTVRVNPSE